MTTRYDREKIKDFMKSFKKDAENDESDSVLPSIESIQGQGRRDRIFDEYDEFKNYKNFMYQEVRKEIQFKSIARKWSLILLAIISGVLFINVFIMIYLNGVWILPDIQKEIILAMITVTFANLFTIITLVFKYIFSPTKELMEHANDVTNGKND